MSEVERIQDQLQRAFEGDAWYGPSVKEVLTRVTAERAAARPLPFAHNIWEIVHHITAWHEGVRRRLEGEVIDYTPEEDWPPVKSTNEVAWTDSLSALEDSYKRLQAAISRLNDKQLEDPVAGKEQSLYIEIHGLIQHDLFHAGQIAILKKA